MSVTIGVITFSVIILTFAFSVMLNVYQFANRNIDIYSRNSAKYWQDIAMRWHDETANSIRILLTIVDYLGIYWNHEKEFPLEDVLYAIDHRNEK